MATPDNYDVIIDWHSEKLLSEDMQRLDAPTHRGKPLTGFRTICRLTDFAEQAKQRLASFGCKRLEPSVLSWTEIADVTSHCQSGLDFGERAPRRIQKPSIIPGALLGRTFRNVEWDAVGRSTQLICESLLLEVRKPLSRFRALDC